jgi:hypothetical protein
MSRSQPTSGFELVLKLLADLLLQVVDLAA